MSLFRGFDHFNVPLGQDGTPFEFFEHLRDAVVESNTPIGWSEAHGGFWVVARHAEARRILHDPKTFTNRVITLPPYGIPGDRPMMLAGMNDPEHARYRRIIQVAFSVKQASALGPALRAATHELIDGFIDDGRVDLVTAFTNALPARLTALLLGLPAEHGDMYQSWVDAMVHGIPSGAPHAADHVREMEDFFAELIVERRRRLGDDLFSLLLQTEADGARLTDQEVKDFFVVLLLGGIDNTAKLLGTVFWRLAWDRELRRRLVNDPSLMTRGWDEFLRYYGSAMDAREVAQPVDIGGVRMEPGQRLLMVFPIVNRDPAEFADPDVFNLARSPNRHLTLGLGIHRCLGAPLVRVEAQAIADGFFRRIPVWELDPYEPPAWQSAQSYGIQRLPIVFPAGGGYPAAGWTAGAHLSGAARGVRSARRSRSWHGGSVRGATATHDYEVHR